MNRNDAIDYSKELVKRVVCEMDNCEDTRILMGRIYDKNDEYYELANKQLDVWAEWIFPDEVNDDKD